MIDNLEHALEEEFASWSMVQLHNQQQELLELSNYLVPSSQQQQDQQETKYVEYVDAL